MTNPLTVASRATIILVFLAAGACAITGHVYVDAVLGLLAVIVLCMVTPPRQESDPRWTDFYCLREINSGTPPGPAFEVDVDSLYKRGFIIRAQSISGSQGLYLSREGKEFLANLSAHFNG